MDETRSFLGKDTVSEEPLTWEQLERLGLVLSYQQEAASGWSYRWRGRNWQGCYPTRTAALAAAFSTAIDCLILSDSCPFPSGGCPLLKPPPLPLLFEGEWSKEEDEDPWWDGEDQED